MLFKWRKNKRIWKKSKSKYFEKLYLVITKFDTLADQLLEIMRDENSDVKIINLGKYSIKKAYEESNSDSIKYNFKWHSSNVAKYRYWL